MVISVLRWVILACHLRIMWNFSCTIYLVVFDISLESLFLSFSQQRMQNGMGLEHSRRIRGWRYGPYPETRSRFCSCLIKISHEDHILFLVPWPWILWLWFGGGNITIFFFHLSISHPCHPSSHSYGVLGSLLPFENAARFREPGSLYAIGYWLIMY